MPASPGQWSIQLDPSFTIAEVAYLMGHMGCRCEFLDGIPTLIPNHEEPLCSFQSAGSAVCTLLARSSRVSSVPLIAVFEKFGLCLRVRPIGVAE